MNTKHKYNDYNVASRSVYEYRITPKLDNNTWLEPALARVNSGFRGHIEGYGVSTGIQWHINYATNGILADQEIRLYRITFSASGQQLVFPGSHFDTVDPAMERTSRIDVGVTNNNYYGYRLEVHETPPPITEEPAYKLFGTGTVTMWASNAPPSPPNTLEASLHTSGSGVNLTWETPVTNSGQVAQYEVLRRTDLPVNDVNKYLVVGTTKLIHFHDKSADATNGAYRYKIRAVTKQDTRSGDSNIVFFPLVPPLACNTNYGTAQLVSKMFVDFDVFNTTKTVDDVTFVDVWAYADSAAEGELDRCINLDTNRLKVKRDIYHLHALDATDCPTTSCDIVDVDPGDNDPELMQKYTRWTRAGWPRHPFERFQMEDMEPLAGVYGVRYQVCAIQAAGTELCSQWRDSGKVNWRVNGPDFDADDIESLTVTVAPHYITE